MTNIHKLKFADAAAIVQAHQKDQQIEELLTSKLEDLIKRFKSQYIANAYSREISIGAKVLYLALTTLRGKRTLGEEYVDLIHVNRQGNLAANRSRRLLFILSYTLVPYALSKVVGLFSRHYNGDGEVVESVRGPPGSFFRFILENGILQKLLNAFTDINLILFYFKGSFYHISKRVFGLRYSVAHKVNESENRFSESSSKTYRILGVIFLIQTLSRDLPPVVRWFTQYMGKTAKNDMLSLSADDRTTLLITGVPSFSQVEHIYLKDSSELQFIEAESRKCILCLEWMTDPSCGPCGHIFCWSCILNWCKERPECPLCRQACQMQSILPIR
ncbi:LANO_0B04588g1_1 [Lachancea nothofagi CBS 11611]|uniref:RING-type E3 ubiquitin transferase n=1 Tax=Lachancea nothofagi CBS 11611 TaxID=1266666 RepID=A0A1G4IXN8_9SACH|nr:LANO_0B04588g1_1 [Lachancea nothofagi CBS 11611]